MQQTTNSISKSYSLQKRPGVITAVCIVGFITLAFVLSGLFIPSVREPVIQKYGFFSFILSVPFPVLLALIGLVGYWKMRKWGVYVYTAMVVFSIGIGFIQGGGLGAAVGNNIFPAFIIGIGFAYLKRMT